LVSPYGTEAVITHNIYMGNYLTITRGNDIKTNQIKKG